MIQIKNIFKRIAYGISIMALIALYYPNVASAAQITGRSVTIGSSLASASTTYAFNFTVPSATVLQSAEFTACTTASGACTTPAGFSVASSTLTGQPTNLGDAAGWTVSTATAGSLRLSKSGNVAAPTGAQTVSFSNVVNPSATNSTFFLRMTTYSTAAWTTPVDTGTVAASTAGQITVTASVDETLTFTLAAATVPLGTLTTSATGAGTSTMTASTNASSGYSITVAGSTLTSGANTITALASPTASSTNTKQFGINLMSNSTPAVGTAVSGSGTGAPATGYNTTNLFKFVTGDTVASASVPTNSNTFTTSYIANINGVTAPGSYSTVLTYVATANF
ncbi:MAG: hypothetical protein ABJA64_01800 [Candidatus Saccharibacteria bacterium]